MFSPPRHFDLRHSPITLVVTLGLAGLWFGKAILGWPLQTHWLTILSLSVAAVGATYYCDLRRLKRRQADVRRHVRVLMEMQPAELAGSEESFDWRGDPDWIPMFRELRDWALAEKEQREEAEHTRSRAEVRLSRVSEQQGQIREVFDSLAEPILVTNQYDELVLANDAAQKLFELADAETRLSLDALTECSQLIEMAREARRHRVSTSRTGEIEIGEESDRRWYRAACRSLTGPLENEETQGAVMVLADISTEKGIQKRHAEFVAAASHEMKTPLASIRAYVELLQDGEAEDDETRDEFLEVIDTQSDRLQRLIENLLNLARIEAGVVNVDKQQHSLNELLDSAFDVVQPTAEQKEIRLTKDLSPLYLGLVADRDMVSQTAINLLSNAIKYTEPGGQVTLRTRMQDQSVIFEVEDSGVGLSEEDAQRVFEKFYRVKKDQKMAGGTGLGLPLAKHIVEDVHGGTLTVTTRLGEGSVFQVALPSSGRGQG